MMKQCVCERSQGTQCMQLT